MRGGGERERERERKRKRARERERERDEREREREERQRQVEEQRARDRKQWEEGRERSLKIKSERNLIQGLQTPEQDLENREEEGTSQEFSNPMNSDNLYEGGSSKISIVSDTEPPPDEGLLKELTEF